ncbi:MAG: CBS domain-containing protein [Xanthomonadales bacterium]|nr:CBS domain-containing protein [Xanthomonadales bacterium]
MKIKDILLDKGTNVITIGADQTIHAAITELNHHGFGALIVTGKDSEVAGIVTERDILKCCGETCSKKPATEHSPCQILIQDIMTKDVVIGVPNDDLDYVMNVMTKHHIRHLPILDDGALAGIISISDLLNAHLEENVFESRTLKGYIHEWGHAR